MTSVQRAFDPLSGPHRGRNRRRNPAWRFRRLFFILGLLAVAAVGGVLYVFSHTELPEDAFEQIAQSSYLCTAEVTDNCGPENATATLASPGEDRKIVTYGELPPTLINAVVATEDQSFFTHRGVDPKGITRAAYQYLRGQGVVQGGSTITQQYVKLAFKDKERTLDRKAREAMRAIKLEQDLAEDCSHKPELLGDRTPQQCAKETILERYLNRAYFGRGASGVSAAARTYFGVEVGQLTVSQSAFIAGLLRNPNGAEPSTHPEEAERRRGTTIKLMADAGYITPEEADAATKEPVVYKDKVVREGLGVVQGAQYGSEYFVEEVRQQLDAIYPNGEIYTKGLQVYTTLDQKKQEEAWKTVYEEFAEDPKRDLPDMGALTLKPENGDPAAAIVTLDGEGRVKAMVGGKNFAESEFNLATSKGSDARQAGSTFKPFALATAIEQGMSAKSFFPANPGTLEIGGRCSDNGKPWKVTGGGNAETRYRDLIDALTVSSNIVFAELVDEIGPDELRDTAREMGINASLQGGTGDGVFTPCSLVLGSQGVPVIEMASAYSTFAREGFRKDPVLIERVVESDGTVCWYPVAGVCTERLSENAPPPERPGVETIQDETARQVNYALTQVVAKGTGKRAALGKDHLIAGKTGTTQNSSDAWFAGFTCDLTTVVWMGFTDAQRPMYDFRKPLPADGKPPVDKNGDPIDDPNWRNVEGGNFPAMIWHEYMTRITTDAPPCTELPVQEDFPGTRYNQELSTTTLPPCGVELDKYGFPKGGSPDKFVPITTVPQQPPTGQGDNNQGLPFQQDGGQAPATNCIPVDQWAGQGGTTVVGGPNPTSPDGSTSTVDPRGPSTVTVTVPDTTDQSTSSTGRGRSTTLPGPTFTLPTFTIPDQLDSTTTNRRGNGNGNNTTFPTN